MHAAVVLGGRVRRRRRVLRCTLRRYQLAGYGLHFKGCCVFVWCGCREIPPRGGCLWWEGRRHLRPDNLRGRGDASGTRFRLWAQVALREEHARLALLVGRKR